jgi:hypothetical protein
VVAAVIGLAIVIYLATQGNVVGVVAVVLIFGFIVFFSVDAALGSRSRWATDDGVALGLHDAGVTWGGIGHLDWNTITGFRIVTDGATFAGKARLWDRLLGTTSREFMSVFVTDRAAVISRRPGAKRLQMAAPVEGKTGFDGVWGQGLSKSSWSATVSAVEAAAAQRGLPVRRN